MLKFKKSQSGRSMVEMLGVLAIIGVLSIGGIAGYRTAMDKYHANEIINSINLLLASRLLKEDANDGKYSYTAEINGYHLNVIDGNFYFSSYQITEGVCKNLVEAMPILTNSVIEFASDYFLDGNLHPGVWYFSLQNNSQDYINTYIPGTDNLESALKNCETDKTYREIVIGWI